MLIKSVEHELWIVVKGGEKVGLVARVPEMLRLDLISTGPDFTLDDLNKWLFISLDGSFKAYHTLEDAKTDLI